MHSYLAVARHYNYENLIKEGGIAHSIPLARPVNENTSRIKWLSSRAQACDAMIVTKKEHLTKKQTNKQKAK